MIEVAVLAIAIAFVAYTRVLVNLHRGQRQTCDHCLHWMHTTDSGLVTYQHCCRCGRVVATHVIDLHSDQPWRTREHGAYLTTAGRPNYKRRHTA